MQFAILMTVWLDISAFATKPTSEFIRALWGALFFAGLAKGALPEN